MNIPIFPLPIFLLPGGITRLRIFEQRYLSMVRNANETQGFAICYANETNQNYQGAWASWVDIIDFEMASDGVLIIDVKCKSLINLVDVERQTNGLLTANAKVKPHWALNEKIALPENLDATDLLTQQLKRFFDLNPELANLYQLHFEQAPTWVCARWLELIPVGFDNKSHFSESDSFHDAIEFLSTLIIDGKEIEQISLLK